MTDETRPVINGKHSPVLVYASALVIGMYLGTLFIKSEVASWQRIHDMFLFKEVYMYLIISLAICVAMLSMLLIKRFMVRSVDGKLIKYEPKPFHSGVIVGGMLFGAGWAITGACPGPVYAQIGAGEWLACFTFLGAMLGMFSYAALKPRLPH
jgi:uncharacterized membrane protein YedE/YeeE